MYAKWKNLKQSSTQIINIEILIFHPRQDETVNKSHATVLLKVPSGQIGSAWEW